MIVNVFNARDTAPLAIEAILKAGSYSPGPKAKRIEKPADWTPEKIKERAAAAMRTRASGKLRRLKTRQKIPRRLRRFQPAPSTLPADPRRAAALQCFRASSAVLGIQKSPPERDVNMQNALELQGKAISAGPVSDGFSLLRRKVSAPRAGWWQRGDPVLNAALKWEDEFSREGQISDKLRETSAGVCVLKWRKNPEDTVDSCMAHFRNLLRLFPAVARDLVFFSSELYSLNCVNSYRFYIYLKRRWPWVIQPSPLFSVFW